MNDIEEVKEKPLRGRGGTGNFPNARYKELIQNEAKREIAKQLLLETYEAYKMPKVHSDEELEQRLDEYFNRCASKGIIPTVEEMCLYTGYAHSTVNEWERGVKKGVGPRSAAIIKNAKAYMSSFDAKLVTSGALNFLTYCFRAKNYYGMKDQQEYVLTPNQQEVRPEDLIKQANLLPDE